MRDEPVDAAALEAARGRVWQGLAHAGDAVCAEFQADLPAYVDGTLSGSRRVLFEDHLSRCPACRSAVAERRGTRTVVPMPTRSVSRAKRWVTFAAAAAVLLAVLYAGRERIDTWFAPGGARATVVSATGSLYRLAGEPLAAGAEIGERELIRTGPGTHAVLRLADGSTIDVNERTELYATAAWSGMAIHLERGDVIVTAAKQRRGHLRVVTRDSMASVKGTVFAVSAGLGGSVVSVVEGSVAVQQPGTDTLLGPGQQAATNAAFESSVAQAVSWSPDRERYLELLGSFAKIEQQLAARFPTGHRSSSALLPYLPGGAFAYGAVPNLAGRITEALSLANQQSSENATFSAWWNSETGRVLEEMVRRLQAVSGMLGEEIVFTASLAGPGQEVPAVLARVQPGRRADLGRALDALFVESGEPALPYSLSEELMVVSNSQPNLAWALGQLGRGAASPFASAIGERYKRGAGWLFGIDAPVVIKMAEGDDAPPVELASMIGMKYAFVEQRAPNGAEENEVTLMFAGARTGMGSWLADAGSGGAAEYLPADALLAGSVSTREPSQLFQEFTALVARADESMARDMAGIEAKLGAGFVTSLTAAMGTEAALAVDGFSVSGVRWTMAGLAYNPAVIDDAVQKFVGALNAEFAADQQDTRVSIAQETANGRVWHTLTGGGLPFGITWTYDRGYLVAASDRGSAERAIATRNSGSPLVFTQAFRSQLPASGGLHPSAFLWLNTKGAFEQFATAAVSPSMARLLSARDPMLVVFDVTPDQIRAASRTRLSGVILDAMALGSLQ